MQEREKRESPEETRRAPVTSAMFTTRQNPFDPAGNRSRSALHAMQRRGKRDTPEKTCQPAVSSGTIPTCEDPGATPPGIEPVSSKLEGSSLSSTPPRPREGKSILHNTLSVAVTSPSAKRGIQDKVSQK
ncbi:hypothetical protein PR048_032794 [Dryococelus australis]|uniref:Uncharacterized protein n=1 Tax=Dryococelus australis TaxID=614101 RepID=A0ABQ9G377_9NEOP|nr:hypothetical protein PR048_032794 [Dryococelus australis]